MRQLIRLTVAHVLASWVVQLIFLAWVLIAGQRINPVKGAISAVLAPILIPVTLLRIGPRNPLIPYGVYWLLYLTTFTAAFLLLRRRASGK